MTPSILFLAITFYFALLFAVACFVERESPAALRLSRSPFVYSLSLAVYCTSWTYYGSVGKAATSGLSFLAIYLGPTIMVCLWWILLRRMVIIKDKHRITSIADFISARYKKSQSLAALVTLIALIGSMPYIALQLEAVKSTLLLMIKTDTGENTWLIDNSGLLIVLAMTFFTILFGARKLDPTERHRGMMAAIAFESIIKLLAFSACGVFATYHLFHGHPEGFLKSLAINPATAAVFRISEGESGYITWATLIILGMSAILFLPRQFHVAVVENSAPENILPAMWQFPLYMFLINIFVVPIALYGITSGIPVATADTYVLSIPFLHGNTWLALFVFLGGFSAAMSMIIIAAMTLSTMFVNHLLLPLFNTLRPLAGLRRYLLGWRWISILTILSVGCWFQVELGTSYALVNMGLISFAAVLQFAPAALCAVFWPGGSMVGALSGLSAGFSVWFYTLLLPAFIKSGLFTTALLDNGPWGIRLLRPEHLFGLNALPPLSHTVFWSLLFNIGAFVLVSALFGQSEEERNIALDFMSITQTKPMRSIKHSGDDSIAIDWKKAALLSVLNDYFHTDKSEEIISTQLIDMSLHTKKDISIIDFAELYRRIEILLAGSIGAAMAHRALDKENIFSEMEKASLARAYANILSRLNVSPQELAEKIDFYRERERLLITHGQELEETVRLRTAEVIENQAFLQEVLEGIQAAVIVIDRETQEVLDCNSTAELLLGCTKQNLTEKAMRTTNALQAAGNGQLLNSELIIQQQNGGLVPVQRNVLSVVYKGAQAQALILFDITERKALERQLNMAQKLQSIGQMAAGIAHEINTPMQFISTNMEFLEEATKGMSVITESIRKAISAAPPEIAQRLQSALDEADWEYLTEEAPSAIEQTKDGISRVTSIVKAMKEFSHPSSRTKEPVVVNSVIETTVLVARNEWKYVSNVTTDLAVDLPPVPCLVDELGQVILNLLINAAHAIGEKLGSNPDGQKGEIHISTRVVDSFVEIRIRDSGSGIPEGIREKIFDPFFTTKEVGRGTGQGLAISHDVITQKHGGTLTFETEEGIGSTFIIRLPL